MAHAPIDIALTGFSGLTVPGPGPAVARALRDGWDGPLQITALSDDAMATGAWVPGLADRIRVLPPAAAGDEPWLELIAETHAERPLTALIPGTESDALCAARLADRLERLGIATLLPSVDGLEAIRPHRLPRLLTAHHIPGPPSAEALDLSDVPWLADQLGYPLFVKTGAGARLVHAPSAARAAAKRLRAAGARPTPVILQRHILGETFGAALLADADGARAGLVVRRGLALDTEGRTVSGAVVDDCEVARFAGHVLEKLNWRGPLELAIVRPARSNELLLCDARPWLPSWSMLCHWAGANLAVALIEHMLAGDERPLARRHARIGTMSIRGIEETAVPLERLIALRRGKSVAGPKAPNGTAARSAGTRGHGLRVAVTGLGTCDVINPGLGVARALRAADGIDRVLGLTYGTLESGAFQPDLFGASFQIPPNGSKEALLGRLREVHAAEPFDVLIPCLDGELPRFIDLAGALRRMGVHTLLPRRASLNRRGKLALFGGKTRRDWDGFTIPESRVARTEAETIKAVRALGFPAVVKGTVCQCIPVDSDEDARFAWAWLSPSAPKAVIVQPRIAGAVYAVSAVCDRDHGVISALTIKKLAICERGGTWGATRVSEPALEAAFAAYLHAISWVGPVEGEFIRDEMTDRFNLIEVNPRFTAWAYFSASTGSNQPYLAARAAMDERVNPPPDTVAVAFARCGAEIPLRAAQVAALATKGALRHG